MSQVSKPFTQPLFKETPATTGFLSHLAANLFFILLLSASLIFTYWSFQVLNQIDPSALQDVGITSLEKTINADGEALYYVAYTVTIPNNEQGQAVSYQRKRIPSALFFELQNNSSLAVRIISDNPLQTQIVPQVTQTPPSFRTVIPICMIGIGLAASLFSAFLLTRSLQFGFESLALNRYGIMTYGVITSRQINKIQNHELEYKLIYQFTTQDTTDPLQAEQTVPFSRFRMMQPGEVVQVRYDRTQPQRSRIEF